MDSVQNRRSPETGPHALMVTGGFTITPCKMRDTFIVLTRHPFRRAHLVHYLLQVMPPFAVNTAAASIIRRWREFGMVHRVGLNWHLTPAGLASREQFIKETTRDTHPTEEASAA